MGPSSWTSKPASAGRSSSILPTPQRRLPSTTRARTPAWSASAAFSPGRWSPPGAGATTTSSLTGVTGGRKHSTRSGPHSTATTRAGLNRGLVQWDGYGSESSVAGVEEGAAGADGFSDEASREAEADQVAVGDLLRGEQATAAGLAGLDLPAAEAGAQVLGVAAEDQRAALVAAVGDKGLEGVTRAAIAYSICVVNHDDGGPSEPGQRCGQLLCGEIAAGKDGGYAGAAVQRAEGGGAGGEDHQAGARGQQRAGHGQQNRTAP